MESRRHRRLHHAFAAAYPEANEERSPIFSAFRPPTLLHPQAFEIARTNARAVRTRSRSKCGCHQRHLARAQAFGNGPTSRESSCLSALGAGILVALRRLGLPHHVAQRRYWFPASASTLNGDNTARILDVKYHMLLPAHERVGGPLDYFQWSRSCARVGADRLSLGLSREREAWLIADLLILRDEMRARSRAATRTWCSTSTTSPAPTAPGPAQRHARTVRARLENSRMTRFSSRECTNSSANSSTTTTASAPPSPSNI